MRWLKRGTFAVILEFNDTIKEIDSELEKLNLSLIDVLITRKAILLLGISSALVKYGFTGQVYHEYFYNYVKRIHNTKHNYLEYLVKTSLELNKFLEEIGNLEELITLDVVLYNSDSILLTITKIEEVK
jgi:hypothetical protein